MLIYIHSTSNCVTDFLCFPTLLNPRIFHACNLVAVIKTQKNLKIKDTYLVYINVLFYMYQKIKNIILLLIIFCFSFTGTVSFLIAKVGLIYVVTLVYFNENLQLILEKKYFSSVCAPMRP